MMTFLALFFKSVFWIYKSTFANKQTHAKTIQGQFKASCDSDSFIRCPSARSVLFNQNAQLVRQMRV